MSLDYVSPNVKFELVKINLITEYHKERYFIFKGSDHSEYAALSDNRVEELYTKLSQNYLVLLVRNDEFDKILEESFANLNTTKAKYWLDFISPAASAKNINYKLNITLFLSGFFILWLFCSNIFVVINNIIFLAQNLFKVVLLLISNKSKQHEAEELLDIADADLPVYTVLVPLYNELFKLKSILKAIDSLDYPKSKLDVKIIIEEDDNLTIKALSVIKVPAYVHIIKVPYSLPRTKPKAMNYAVSFAKGEYLVIYDAEDRPHPLQLKKALYQFSQLPDNYVCLQGKLNFYNAKENILTKLFSVEYSLWFNYLLTGLSLLRLPVPLGGTSNHFKIAALKEVGFWDAYNVTEDAELGIRLSYYGYKVQVFDSLTLEESPVSLGNWLYQRSRWIKGFIQTTLVLVHNKTYNKKLSFLEKVTVYIFVGMSSYSFFCLPWIMISSYSHATWWVKLMFMVNVFFQLSFTYATYVIIVFKDKKFQDFTMTDILTFLIWPFYFLLHSVACNIAIYQALINPFKWNKTDHGESKSIPDL